MTTAHGQPIGDNQNSLTDGPLRPLLMQGIETWMNAEAEAVVGKDRETSQCDLFEAIQRGEFPKWKFQVQMPAAVTPPKPNPSHAQHPRKYEDKY